MVHLGVSLMVDFCMGSLDESFLLVRIIHAGTGIPELTIDQLTNQKIQKYHRRATDIIHERKNDK